MIEERHPEVGHSDRFRKPYLPVDWDEQRALLVLR